MVTMLLCGTEDGSVYVVVAPLAVCARLNVPHGSPVATVQLHFTPAFVESFAAVAANPAVVPVRIDSTEGWVVKVTAMGLVVVVTATVTLALFVASATEVPVMVTLPPSGPPPRPFQPK